MGYRVTGFELAVVGLVLNLTGRASPYGPRWPRSMASAVLACA
jgi:hypothetical protein